MRFSVTSIPVADGGEGTVDAFLTAVGGERIPLVVQGSWGDRIESFYGILPDGTAVIEMAAAAGLPLAGDRLDPSRTTTYGVGHPGPRLMEWGNSSSMPQGMGRGESSWALGEARPTMVAAVL